MAYLPNRPDGGCWLWAGASDARYGYGVVNRGSRKQFKAHRLAYETWVGPIPEGATIEHSCHTADPSCLGAGGKGSCRHRLCCNPAHLKPMDAIENVMLGNSQAARNARKTHCLRGHEFDIERKTPAGNIGRGCSRCNAIRYRIRTENARVEASLEPPAQ